MKKATLSLLVIGIAVTSSAQQQDFLDLQLQKIIKHTPAVKPILAKPVLPKMVYSFQPSPKVNHNTLSHVLSNGDKVYLLAQDNMPCIVPDMSKFKIAGVYGKSETPLSSDKVGSIPNVAIKPKSISR